jgi:hypothetical protein
MVEALGASVTGETPPDIASPGAGLPVPARPEAALSTD